MNLGPQACRWLVVGCVSAWFGWLSWEGGMVGPALTRGADDETAKIESHQAGESSVSRSEAASGPAASTLSDDGAQLPVVEGGRMAEEIVRLRQRLGIDPLRGTLLESADRTPLIPHDPASRSPGRANLPGDRAGEADGFESTLRESLGLEANTREDDPTTAERVPPNQIVLDSSLRALTGVSHDLRALGYDREAQELTDLLHAWRRRWRR